MLFDQGARFLTIVYYSEGVPLLCHLSAPLLLPFPLFSFLLTKTCCPLLFVLRSPPLPAPIPSCVEVNSDALSQFNCTRLPSEIRTKLGHFAVAQISLTFISLLIKHLLNRRLQRKEGDGQKLPRPPCYSDVHLTFWHEGELEHGQGAHPPHPF